MIPDLMRLLARPFAVKGEPQMSQIYDEDLGRVKGEFGLAQTIGYPYATARLNQLAHQQAREADRIERLGIEQRLRDTAINSSRVEAARIAADAGVKVAQEQRAAQEKVAQTTARGQVRSTRAAARGNARTTRISGRSANRQQKTAADAQRDVATISGQAAKDQQKMITSGQLDVEKATQEGQLAVEAQRGKNAIDSLKASPWTVVGNFLVNQVTGDTLYRSDPIPATSGVIVTQKGFLYDANNNPILDENGDHAMGIRDTLEGGSPAVPGSFTRFNPGDLNNTIKAQGGTATIQSPDGTKQTFKVDAPQQPSSPLGNTAEGQSAGLVPSTPPTTLPTTQPVASQQQQQPPSYFNPQLSDPSSGFHNPQSMLAGGNPFSSGGVGGTPGFGGGLNPQPQPQSQPQLQPQLQPQPQPIVRGPNSSGGLNSFMEGAQGLPPASASGIRSQGQPTSPPAPEPGIIDLQALADKEAAVNAVQGTGGGESAGLGVGLGSSVTPQSRGVNEELGSALFTTLSSLDELLGTIGDPNTLTDSLINSLAPPQLTTLLGILQEIQGVSEYISDSTDNPDNNLQVTDHLATAWIDILTERNAEINELPNTAKQALATTLGISYAQFTELVGKLENRSEATPEDISAGYLEPKEPSKVGALLDVINPIQAIKDIYREGSAPPPTMLQQQQSRDAFWKNATGKDPWER